jgi:hypothetical protein
LNTVPMEEVEQRLPIPSQGIWEDMGVTKTGCNLGKMGSWFGLSPEQSLSKGLVRVT